MVIRAVFGKLLTREKSVDILKSRFDVKQSNLTNLTASQVMSVLVKKLVRHNYVTLKENVSSLGDVTVHKEIAMLKKLSPYDGSDIQSLKTPVLSVLVKKLVMHNYMYVTLKENVSSLGDVTVHKEIAI